MEHIGFARITVVSVLLWLVAVATCILRAVDVLPHGAWCGLAVGFAATVSVIAYTARRADRIEGEAFERGLNAGIAIRQRVDSGM